MTTAHAKDNTNGDINNSDNNNNNDHRQRQLAATTVSTPTATTSRPLSTRKTLAGKTSCGESPTRSLTRPSLAPVTAEHTLLLGQAHPPVHPHTSAVAANAEGAVLLRTTGPVAIIPTELPPLLELQSSSPASHFPQDSTFRRC